MIKDIWKSIKDVIAVLFEPSARDEAPYLAMVIGIGHGVVGAALVDEMSYFWENAGIAFIIGIRFLIGIGYWIIKEYGDIKRGGSIGDGIIDAIYIFIGSFYGMDHWPLILLFAAGMQATIIQYKLNRKK